MEDRQFKSDNISELAKALAAAQAEMKPAPKDSQNPYFKSSYADLATCWEAARGPLTKNGLSVVQLTTPGNDGSSVNVESVLLHTSGEWIKGVLQVKLAKQDPQGLGSALTYGRRYGFMALIGLAPADDDGEAAAGRVQQKAQPQAATQQPPQRPAQEQQQADPALATKPQLQKINILIQELGIHDRQSKLNRLNKWLASRGGNRQVQSSSELSQAEAHALIDALDKQVNQEKANANP